MIFSDKKILVTGGAGFIGSNIVKTLLEKGAKVSVLDNFSTGRRENTAPFKEKSNFELMEGDLRSYTTVREAVRGKDFIFHQAALPSVQRSIDDPVTTNNVNILGTLNVLEATKEFGAKRIIYASSSSIYGNSKVLPKKEDLPAQPLSPYALSKYVAERYCQLYYKIYGLETVSLRYFNVFGPNQDPNSQYSAAVPKFISSMKKGESPTIYGDGLQSRDFTWVDNVVEANILACQAERTKAAGQVFNIASGKAYNLLQLVDILNKLLGRQIKPNFSRARAGDVKHSLASIEKAKTNLGYEPKVDFLKGLEKLINYD